MSKIEIETGDAFELIAGVADESIDLILCDPVYWEVEQYAWLARTAGRVLKPGRSLVAQSGAIYRFECELAMYDPRLERRPLLVERFSGGYLQLWKYRAMKAGHYWLWAEKMPIDTGRGWPLSVFQGVKDKSAHEWGDGVSASIRLIETFTKVGDCVLDPFSGGGTVAAASFITGRDCLAFEIDPAKAEAARERLAAMPPNLPLPAFNQARLIE